MKRDSQYYSKIALKYLQELSKECRVNYTYICWGNLNDMEELFDLFGGDRDYLRSKPQWSPSKWIRYKFQFVMNKLERESKKPNAIFKKGYICYNGIINRPTRCFYIKEENKTKESFDNE